MDLHDAALVIAGIVGSTTAIVHGAVTQRQMVRPVHELTAGKLPQSIRRLVAALLHFSTFNWFVSGLALLIAVYSFGREARLATCLLVGSSYLYPALGNLWATRGRHVGWVLYTIAVPSHSLRSWQARPLKENIQPTTAGARDRLARPTPSTPIQRNGTANGGSPKAWHAIVVGHVTSDLSPSTQS